MSNQQYFGLNDTGARMWDLLVTLGDTSEVVSRMEQDYAVPVDTLTADLEALVQELLDAGLLRQSSTI
ncbi:MAG: Coenzyme synthesis protein (PqqD) [Bryobacterales bacterium]|nr:Coenzyme synthesis protein (PqqD) [Bryobacterales bacterium]